MRAAMTTHDRLTFALTFLLTLGVLFIAYCFWDFTVNS